MRDWVVDPRKIYKIVPKPKPGGIDWIKRAGIKSKTKKAGYTDAQSQQIKKRYEV